ncbi:MAG: phosphoribosyltransferase family protein [archaeon]
MRFEYYDKLINKKTTGRYDITPIFENADSFNNLIKDLIKPFNNLKIDKIVGIDALGFILGGAIAIKLKKGFIPIRKAGKLPSKSLLKVSFKDYSKEEKAFEMNKSSIKRREKVLLVDEWIETGTQIHAAIKLIKKQKGKVVGIATLNLDKNNKTQVLLDKYNCKPINISNEK